MRALFGMLGVVMVLAIVGWLMKQQTQTLSGGPAPAAQEAPPVVNTPSQARAVEAQIRHDLNQALQSAAPRGEPEP